MADQQGNRNTLTVIQRFGGGLNLNVHFHTLALDGVFTEPGPGGPLVFHAAPPPSDAEVGRMVITVRRRVLRLLAHQGYEQDAEAAPDLLAEESRFSPSLAMKAVRTLRARHRDELVKPAAHLR